MKKNVTQKILKYLSENPEGSLRKLVDKFHSEKLKPIYRSNLLNVSISEDKYSFSQEGVDYYCKTYGQFERKNFLGL